MKQCGDFERLLSMASLGCGLVAAIILSVSVSTDYWLLTDEPWATEVNTTGSSSAYVGPNIAMFSTYSGLWRACIYLKPDVPLPAADGDMETTEPPDHQYYDENEMDFSDDQAASCSMIAYFDQGFERIEGGETSTAIWRGIRRSTPVIMLSLFLMITAEILAVFGYLREDFRTVIGAVLSIIAALSLALGQIFYISAVNDEASQWKRPDGATEAQSFSYGYGWAFYSAGSSFVVVMVAAVGHISVYLRRYVTDDVRRMLIIVPGLNVRKIEAAAATNCANATAAGCARRGSSPASPTMQFNSQRPHDSNGTSRPTTIGHRNLDPLAPIAQQQQTPAGEPWPELVHPGSQSAMCKSPVKLLSGSPSYDSVQRMALLMMATEPELPQQQQHHYQPHHHLHPPHEQQSALPYQSSHVMSGSRMQSDIF